MKGEYAEPNKNDSSAAATNMFSKIHHPHPLHHHHNPLPFSHHFHLIPGHDHHPPSEDDSAATSRPSSTTPDINAGHTSTKLRTTGGRADVSDGATIEVVRRPRGRPPGSRNKPKPTVVVPREPEPIMSPYILEVPGGADIVEAISRFCRRKAIGLCLLTGSGTVANVTLRQPSAANAPPGATVTFHGRFEILSISATFLHHSLSFPVPNGFSISLAGPQGQIVGGYVAGPLVAAGPVFVVAASFNNPSYHRLMPEEREEGRRSGSEGHSSPASAGDSGQQQPHQPGVESCGMQTMYSCHMPTDVMWAPPGQKQEHQQHHY